MKTLRVLAACAVAGVSSREPRARRLDRSLFHFGFRLTLLLHFFLPQLLAARLPLCRLASPLPPETRWG